MRVVVCQRSIDELVGASHDRQLTAGDGERTADGGAVVAEGDGEVALRLHVDRRLLDADRRGNVDADVHRAALARCCWRHGSHGDGQLADPHVRVIEVHEVARHRRELDGVRAVVAIRDAHLELLHRRIDREHRRGEVDLDADVERPRLTRASCMPSSGAPDSSQSLAVSARLIRCGLNFSSDTKAEI